MKNIVWTQTWGEPRLVLHLDMRNGGFIKLIVAFECFSECRLCFCMYDY